MSKYHINANTGKPGPCTATKRPCPHGGEDVHFDSVEEAQAAYERNMADSTFVAVKKSPINLEVRENIERLRSLGLDERGSANLDTVEQMIHTMYDTKDKRIASAVSLRLDRIVERSEWLGGVRGYDANREDARRAFKEILRVTKPLTVRKYPSTAGGAATALADQLAYSDLQPASAYSQQYHDFVNKPTSANYKALVEAVREAEPYSGTNYSEGGDQVARLVKASVPVAKGDKRRGHNPAAMLNVVTAAEDWTAYDAKYPRASGRSDASNLEPATDVPADFKPVDGYHKVPNTTFQVPGAKGSPNGGQMMASRMKDGWYAVTSAGIALRGPFATADQVADCVRERELPGGPHYYD